MILMHDTNFPQLPIQYLLTSQEVGDWWDGNHEQESRVLAQFTRLLILLPLNSQRKVIGMLFH